MKISILQRLILVAMAIAAIVLLVNVEGGYPFKAVNWPLQLYYSFGVMLIGILLFFALSGTEAKK